MSTNSPAPLAYRIPEACTRIGVGRTTLYELIRAGELRTVKFGARTLVLDEDLRAVIAARITAPASEASPRAAA